MSSLKRYKKSGGFVQLLSLIETFGPQKKEKFLEMIDSQSQVWGDALRAKMLSVERIFAWPDQVVLEILKHLPPKTMVYSFESLKPDHRTRLMGFLSQGEKRRFEDVISEGPPRPDDLTAAMVKVIETSRRMISEGELRPEKFDAELHIPEDIESKLDNGSNGTAAAKGSAINTAPTPNTAFDVMDVAQLQRTLSILIKENRTMKDEIHNLRTKLDQIRKIA